jgi:predicted Zn-ribbon and HTH transcriptional regulator
MISNKCVGCGYKWDSSEPVVMCPECQGDLIFSVEIKIDPDKPK